MRGKALCCSLYLAKGQSPWFTESLIRGFLIIVYFFAPVDNNEFVFCYCSVMIHQVLYICTMQLFPWLIYMKRMVSWYQSWNLVNIYNINIFSTSFTHYLLIETLRLSIWLILMGLSSSTTTWFLRISKFLNPIFDLSNWELIIPVKHTYVSS